MLDVLVLDSSCDDYLVINKPAGLHSVRNPRSQAASVADWLMQHYPQLSEVSPNREDCGLVNRLDFYTSGVMIAARSREVWLWFRAKYAARSILKSYVCLVEGSFPAPLSSQVVIRTPRRGALVSVRSPGKSLPTRSFVVTANFQPVRHIQNDLTLIRVGTRDGVRHVVRATAAYLGFPLSGDSDYGAKSSAPLAGGGFALHAEALIFTTHASATPVVLRAPVPTSWQQEWIPPEYSSQTDFVSLGMPP